MRQVESHRREIAADVTRREFTAASISALFVGMGVTLVGCGGAGGGGYSTAPSSPAGATASNPQSGDKSGQISSNHGHTAVITAVQLQAGGAVTLQIQGTSDHSHALQLNADQVRQIAAGTKLSKATDPAQTATEYGAYGEHDHTVTFN